MVIALAGGSRPIDKLHMALQARKKKEEQLCNKSYGGLLCLLRVWWPAVQVWERPAIAVTHLPTGEKWAKGYDLQLRFYSVDQYPQVGGGEWPRAADCVGVGRVGV